MDEVGKHRLTGAAIWLGLLVIVVPIWFSQPVNFKPEGYIDNQFSAERPLVDHAYVVPESAVQNRVKPVLETKPVKQVSINSTAKKQADIEVAKKATVKAVEKKSTQSVKQTTKQAGKPRWIVRIIAYKDIKNANDMLGRLEKSYEVYIKTFEKSGVHSVRAGPYISKAKAEQDRQKLDKMLHAKTEVVQLN